MQYLFRLLKQISKKCLIFPDCRCFRLGILIFFNIRKQTV